LGILPLLNLLKLPTPSFFYVFSAVLCLGMSEAHAELVIQLSAGAKDVLEQEAKRLQSQWPDARVVEVEGKAKLVVGRFFSTREAEVVLQRLKEQNPQVFLRRILPESQREAVKPTTSLPLPTPATVASLPESSSPPSRTVEALVEPVTTLQQTAEVSIVSETQVVASQGTEAAPTSAPLASPPEATIEQGELVFQEAKTQLSDEPVDLMRSPLYLLPEAGEKSGTNAITMQMISKAVTKLSPQVTTSPLMIQLAELVDQQRWLEAKRLITKTPHAIETLGSQEAILVGWVYLHNQQPHVAIRYFNQALRQKPSNDARYGLGLSYLLLNDLEKVKQTIKQMSTSPQQAQLTRLLDKSLSNTQSSSP
jgi:hypothetical protein